jgi:hypothetical protein
VEACLCWLGVTSVFSAGQMKLISLFKPTGVNFPLVPISIESESALMEVKLGGILQPWGNDGGQKEAYWLAGGRQFR